MSNIYYVYILANKYNGTLYVGMTDDLQRHIWEHKQGMMDGFTKEHAINRLVYFETKHDGQTAIRREKRLKRWNRQWKIEMIEKENPEWNDLYNAYCEGCLDPRARSLHSLGGELC